MAYEKNGPQDAEVSQISFYANRLNSNFDKTTNPDLSWDGETITAVNSIGEAIADGGNVPDVIDTNRKSRPVVDTSGDILENVHIDMDLDEDITADFAILDNNDLRTGYAETMTKSLKIRQGNSAYASATPVVPTCVQSKKLASGSPYYSFDGVNDYVSIVGSDTPEYSIVARVRFRDFDNGWICGNTTQDNYRFGATSSTVVSYNDDTGDKNITVDEMQLNTWIHFVITADVALNNNLYINGVLVDTRSTGANHLVRFMNALGRANANYLDGDIAEFSYYNRVLSSDEILDMCNNAQDYPLEVDKWGEQAVYESDFSADVDGWARTTGDANFVLSAPETVATVGNTLKCAASGGNVAVQVRSGTIPLIIGDPYRITFDYYVDASSGLANLGLGLDGDRIGSDNIVIVEGSWQTGQVLVGDANADGLRLAAFTSAAGSSVDVMTNGKNIYFTNVEIDRLGTVAAYEGNGVRNNLWIDESDNGLNGSVFGATSINRPDTANGTGDFTVVEFDELTEQYWYWDMNATLKTSFTDEIQFGQIGLGKKFTPTVNPDATFVKDSGYGIDSGATTGGRVHTNRRFGKKRIFQFNWSYVSADDLLDFEQFFDTIEPSEGYSNYPFWFSINSDKPDEQFYYGRTVNRPAVTSLTWGAYSVSMVIETSV